MVIDSNSGIQSTGNSPRSRVTGNSGEGQSPAPRNNDESTSVRAEVSLSDAAQQLNRLESQINTAADVDSDRVEALQRAIADGSYSVNAERIAERMLDQDDLFA